MSQQTTIQPDLDALFSTARDCEPDLTDANFTKVVLNRLPAQSQQKTERSWLPDLVGIVVAVLAIAVLVEPASLYQRLVSAIPNSLIISAPNMLMVSGALVLTSLIGWWVVERGA